MWWEVWYDGGQHCTGSSTEWTDLPDEGVLIVVEYTTDGKRNVHHGRDYYLLRGSTVMSFDSRSLHGQLKEGIPRGAIKFGRWVTDEAWKAAWNQAFPEQPIT